MQLLTVAYILARSFRFMLSGTSLFRGLGMILARRRSAMAANGAAAHCCGGDELSAVSGTAWTETGFLEDAEAACARVNSS